MLVTIDSRTIYFTEISEEDLDLIDTYYWDCDGAGYICAPGPNPGLKKPIHPLRYLHRAIAERIYGDVTGVIIDHANGNKRDNRRCNLRLASKVTSGYKGVSLSKNKKKWRSYITVNKKRIGLGEYDLAEDAAKAYNEAAIMYFGEFAVINVIRRQY